MKYLITAIITLCSACAGSYIVDTYSPSPSASPRVRYVYNRVGYNSFEFTMDKRYDVPYYVLENKANQLSSQLCRNIGRSGVYRLDYINKRPHAIDARISCL